MEFESGAPDHTIIDDALNPRNVAEAIKEVRLWWLADKTSFFPIGAHAGSTSIVIILVFDNASGFYLMFDSMMSNSKHL